MLVAKRDVRRQPGSHPQVGVDRAGRVPRLTWRTEAVYLWRINIWESASSTTMMCVSGWCRR